MAIEFEKKFNELIVDTFNQIKKVEEATLRKIHNGSLSISEYHLLESAGRDSDGVSVSDIAQNLGITPASVTNAVNKLERKGFVEKKRCSDDGRIVYVRLTREGRRMNAGHKLFHRHLTKDLIKGFNSEELDLLVKCITKINVYFKKNDRESTANEL